MRVVSFTFWSLNRSGISPRYPLSRRLCATPQPVWTLRRQDNETIRNRATISVVWSYNLAYQLRYPCSTRLHVSGKNRLDHEGHSWQLRGIQLRLETELKTWQNLVQFCRVSFAWFQASAAKSIRTTLLNYCAASGGNFSPTFPDNLLVLSSGFQNRLLNP
jgi:hypothetical protein